LVAIPTDVRRVATCRPNRLDIELDGVSIDQKERQNRNGNRPEAGCVSPASH